MTVLGLTGCRLDSTYACSSDAQCTDGARTGRCEFDGYCSFEDAECPSGRRYGRWASPQLARACVETSAAATSTSSQPPVPASTGNDASSTSSADGSTTMEATTASTGSSSTGASDSTDESSSTGAPDLDPDLVAWYRFDALNDGVLDDSSGNGHAATCTECPAVVGGVFGNAVELDGLGQHLTVPSDPAFTMETWSLTAWVWLDAAPPSFTTVVGKPVGAGTGNSFEIGVFGTSTTTVQSGWSDGTMGQGLSAQLPGFGQWVHVATTLSDTTASLYIDGALADEDTIEVVHATDDQDVLLGADLDDQVLENFFGGRIDDVRIYRRALTEQDVALVMAGENL